MTFDLLRFVDVYARWLRAEALRSLNRDAEALRWYRAVSEGEVYGATPEMALLAPSRLRLAELHERQGDVASARRLYGQFADLWADADPEAREVVRAAALRAATSRDER